MSAVMRALRTMPTSPGGVSVTTCVLSGARSGSRRGRSRRYGAGGATTGNGNRASSPQASAALRIRIDQGDRRFLVKQEAEAGRGDGLAGTALEVGDHEPHERAFQVRTCGHRTRCKDSRMPYRRLGCSRGHAGPPEGRCVVAVGYRMKRYLPTRRVRQPVATMAARGVATCG